MNPTEFALAPRDACVPGTPHAQWGPDRIGRNVYDAAGARSFYHADGHGSIVAVSSATGSAAAARPRRRSGP